IVAMERGSRRPPGPCPGYAPRPSWSRYGERLTLVLLNVGDQGLSVTLDPGDLAGRGRNAH
ncbi:MAG TPA: hypothetical protein PLU22_27430, partial [Polyangiaceae bacterium]|nr:hypothetical protein [Polyangiaceae bacterium]